MTTVQHANQMQSSYFAAFSAAGSPSSIGYCRTKLRIEFLRTAGKVVLQLAGQLDETTTSQLEREITFWLNRGERTIALDLDGVEVVRRAGVRSILMIGNLLESAGGRLVLIGLFGSIRGVFRMYAVDGVFETFENLDEFESQLHGMLAMVTQ